MKTYLKRQNLYLDVFKNECPKEPYIRTENEEEACLRFSQGLSQYSINKHMNQSSIPQKPRKKAKNSTRSFS